VRRCHPLSERYGLILTASHRSNKKHYRAKLYQELSSSVQVIGHFLNEKNAKTALKVKDQGQMFTSTCDHFTATHIHSKLHQFLISRFSVFVVRTQQPTARVSFHVHITASSHREHGQDKTVSSCLVLSVFAV